MSTIPPLSPSTSPPPTDANLNAKNSTEWAKLTAFLAGVSSGTTKLAVGHPFDTVKVRLQSQTKSNVRFNGAFECMVRTIQKEGITGLYKGASPPLVGWAIMDSIMLGTLTSMKIYLSKDGSGKGLSYIEHGISGSCAGMTVCIVATPIELVKSQLQVQYDATSTRYTGPLDCISRIVRENGFIGLWRGFPSNLVFRSLFAILWSSYEFYTRLFTKFEVTPSLVPFFAGGMAANTFWFISFPTDVVRGKIFSQPDTRPLKYPTWMSCVRFIYSTDGLRGFYRGFLPCMLRSFPANGAAILAFDTTHKYLNKIFDIRYS